MRYRCRSFLTFILVLTIFSVKGQNSFDSVFNLSKKNIINNFYEAKNIQSNYKEYVFFQDSSNKIASLVELNCVIENEYAVIKDVYESINRRFFLLSADKYDSIETNSFTNPYQYSPIYQKGINGGNNFFNATSSPISFFEIVKSMKNIKSSKSSNSCRVSDFLFDTLAQKNNVIDTIYQNISCLKIVNSLSIKRKLDTQKGDVNCVAEWQKQIENSVTTVIINKSDFAILQYSSQKTFSDSNNKKFYMFYESTYQKDNDKYYEKVVLNLCQDILTPHVVVDLMTKIYTH